MTDPYAPLAKKMLTEVGDPLGAFLGRLDRLGAPPDMIEAVRAHWHDPEWDGDERADLISWSDDRLRHELRAVLDEHEHDTTTEEEQAEHEAAAIEVHMAEARATVLQNVPEVVGWIGDDRARAVAVWIAEHEHNDPPRKGVTGAAYTLASDWLSRAGLVDEDHGATS